MPPKRIKLNNKLSQPSTVTKSIKSPCKTKKSVKTSQSIPSYSTKRKATPRNMNTYSLSDEEDDVQSTVSNILGNFNYSSAVLSPAISRGECSTSSQSIGKTQQAKRDIINLRNLPSFSSYSESVLINDKNADLRENVNKESTTAWSVEKCGPMERILPSSSSNNSITNTNVTDAGIYNYVNQILALDEYNLKRCNERTTSDIIAEADKLLSENLDLLETSNSAGDDSVLFDSLSVNAPVSRRERMGRNHSEVEIIDLSSESPLQTINLNSNKTENESSSMVANLKKSIESQKECLGDCPICLGPLRKQQVVTTICGHLYCAPCIRNCVKIAKHCPKCRKVLNMNQIIPLFL